ncbi:MAG TPA: F0F1 ATP synthase subunit B [Nitrospiria bacterium]|nr:F0F1 ATP synthase subunit B [Nitrospiria bacterium]
MDLELKQILTQIAGFIILLWLLKKFAWGHILNMLDERRNKIASEFQTIEESKKDLSILKNEYESKLSEIETYTQTRLREGIKEGERIAKEIIDKAREEAIKLLKEKEQEIKKEREKALKDLETRIIDLSVTIASKVIGKTLSKEDNLKIVNEFISTTQNLDLIYDAVGPDRNRSDKTKVEGTKYTSEHKVKQ